MMRSNKTYDLLIIFRSGEKHIVEGVSEYGLAYDHRDVFYYNKNNCRGLLPADAISFIGKEFDYNNRRMGGE